MMMIKDKRMLTGEWAKRYQESSKAKRGDILEEFTALTGYNRCYASFILSHWNRKVSLRIQGEEVIFLLGKRPKKKRKTKPRIYDDGVLKLLKKLWCMSDCLCGKRLASYIRETLPVLENYGEINVDETTKEKLMKISPATIDRLLSGLKRRVDIKPRSRTKPGSLLKHKIPIRKFSDWEENRPGFVEIDLVSHDGGNARGDFIQSLNVTDVFTGWTEMQAVRNKAQIWVCLAIDEIKGRLPFELLGIDSDNGSEFINTHLESYCNSNKITFTRTRPNRKNDNCFVEQKNFTAIRKTVGYARHDTEYEQRLLNEIYSYLRIYMNFLAIYETYRKNENRKQNKKKL